MFFSTDRVLVGLEITPNGEGDLVCCWTGAYRLAMEYRDRIAIDPLIRFGKPCVKGTRITVGDVLSYLAAGMRQEEILADFPQLTMADIRACLAYAAARERVLSSFPAG